MSVEAPRCPRCRQVGLIRMERIIKGTDTLLAYNCWACEHTWNVSDASPKLPLKPPKNLAKRKLRN